MRIRSPIFTPVAVLASMLLSASATTLADGYCYVVADQPGRDNAYLYDFTGGGPTATPAELALAGNTGTNNIEASEFNPIDKTYYAWDANVFGTIGTSTWDDVNQSPDLLNPGTGAFTPISTETSAVCGLQGGSYVCGPNGSVGTGSNYDIDGMAYNPVSDLWFGSIRIDDGGGRRDWLVVFDNSGNIVEDYFGYNDAPTNDQPIGFVEVQSQGGLDDIDDLGFNVVTGELYGVANEGGNSNTVLVGINTSDGSTTDLGTLKLVNSTVASCGTITGDAYLTDVEGVSIDLNGNIFAVTGNNGHNASSSGDNACLDNSMFFLGTVADLGLGDLDATYLMQMSETDQESISCLVYDPVTVGDTVFEDRNNNGAPDTGEGIAGVTVDVYNVATGDLVGSKVTDSNGYYLYQGLVPDNGGYRVQVSAANFLPGAALDGMLMTVDPDTPGAPDNQGTTGGLPNEGDADTAMDFGYQLLSGIIGEVRLDTDGNGDIADLDSGIDAVTLQLFSDPNGDGDHTVDGVLVDTTASAGDGSFAFTDVPPGNYVVVETDPSGHTSSGESDDISDNRIAVTRVSDTPVAGLIFLDTTTASSITIDARAVCVQDAPWVEFDITPVNFTPNNLATVEWIGSDGEIVRTDSNQPLSGGRLLWPEAAVNGSGDAVAWPGWEFTGGQWVEIPSTVRPDVTVRISVNPTSEVVMSYPPATSDCAAAPPVPAITGGSGGSRSPVAVPTMPFPGLALMMVLIAALGARRTKEK